MYDLAELKARGVSSGAYKAIFTAETKPRRIQKLVDTISQRIHDSTEVNLSEYRTYWAIDLAHQTPFAQTTPTLVQNLLSRHLSAEDTLRHLESWGLSERELFIEVEVEGGVKKVLNPPIFFQILLPIVRAYHTAKLAKIYNERDTSPLFKYRPSKNTDADRVKCEIVTDICDTTSQWYGYPEYLKQAIGQMLKYGIVLAFPMEEWHYEEQVIGGRVVVQREGLRYNMPHPTRMAFDLNHPTPTFNTDTGCEYALHWDLKRYGDILDNRMYWNRNAITYGTNWMDRPIYRNYFNEVYPCRLKFPVVGDPNRQREDKAAFYNTSERDTAVFLTEFFWKIVPARWGLADYKYPVWHRFTVASDNTILWAAPCAYNPVWFMGYDFDSQAGMASSFSLETIPWQDHLGNILSQMILTAKQNLENIVFYDRLLVQKKDIDAIAAQGNKRYVSRVYTPYDSEKVRRAGLDPERAFFSPQFQYRSIVELQSMLSTALNIMERTLGITAQETGAAAQHYQGKEEILAVKSSGDNRSRFTASSVDAGIDAWMQQIYEGNMAYRDDEVTAHVSSQIPDLDRILAELGFSIIGNGPHKKLVGGNKQVLAYLTFARKNVDPTVATDPQAAQVIFQAIGVIANNQEFLQQIGTQRVIKLLEQAAKFAGAPSDFDITSRITEQQPGPAFMEQLQPVLQQLQQTIMQGVTENVAKPAAESAAKAEAEIQQIQGTLKQLEGIYKLASAQNDKNAIRAAETQQRIQERQAAFAAEEARKQQKHELEMQRLRESTGAEIQGKLAKTAADVEAVKIKSSLAKTNAES